LKADKLVKINLASGKAIYSGNSCTFGKNIKITGNGRVGTYDFDSGVLIATWVTGVTINGAIIQTTSQTKHALAVTCSNVTITGNSQIIGIERAIYQYTSLYAKTLNITGGTVKTNSTNTTALIVCDSLSTTNISGKDTLFANID